MLDITVLRDEEGSAHIAESLRRRFRPASLLDEAKDLDARWRAAQYATERKKCANREIFAKSKNDPQFPAIKGKLNGEFQELKLVAQKLELARDAKLKQIGNLVHDSVPVSNDESDNSVVRQWGVCRQQDGLANHVSLCEALNIVDFKRGSAVAGHRGYYLSGDGVQLNLALISFGLKFLGDRGFKKMRTPCLMEKPVMEKCAQLSQFDEELYEIPSDGKYLVATSEQPLCAAHAGESVPPEDLPMRYAGVSTCFRKEAGSHGRDTLGIFRVHEFEKVEQFCMTAPDKSWEMLEEMLEHSEEFYRELGLPYRVVSIVSGALNDAAAKKYDLEAWFPGSGCYRELVSCSNCTDYQARDLGIKYGTGKSGKTKFVHLLNSTLTATQRTICCILETFQTEGGVHVPTVLQPYMDGRSFLPFMQRGKEVVPRAVEDKNIVAVDETEVELKC